MNETQELENWAKQIKKGKSTIEAAHESFIQSFGSEKAADMLSKLLKASISPCRIDKRGHDFLDHKIHGDGIL